MCYIYSALFISAGLAFIVTPVIKQLAVKWKILDFPEKRKIHKRAVPCLGGAVIFVSFLLALGKSAFVVPALRGIMAGGCLIFLTGLIDDIKGLGAKIKLILQILAALILVSQGVILSFLPPTFLGKAGAVILTVIWIVGITNGMNFFDGMDGLAAGLTAIAGLSFLIIAVKTNQLFLGFASAGIAGSCLGFLPYNFYPAKIFLGDSGSTLLGFTLAALAVMGGWAESNPLIALGIPLIILGLLIFDLVYITISRIGYHKVRNFRQWIDYVGKDHLHHRLYNLGLSQRQTVLIIYLIGVYLGLSGFILSSIGGEGALLILIQGFLMFMLITILMAVGRKKSHKQLN